MSQMKYSLDHLQRYLIYPTAYAVWRNLPLHQVVIMRPALEVPGTYSYDAMEPQKAVMLLGCMFPEGRQQLLKRVRDRQDGERVVVVIIPHDWDNFPVNDQVDWCCARIRKGADIEIFDALKSTGVPLKTIWQEATPIDGVMLDSWYN